MKTSLNLILIFCLLTTLVTAKTGAKTGESFQAVIEETCAYDIQMCPVDPESPMARLTGGIGNITGMTGNSLRTVLGDDEDSAWIFEDSLYPRLKIPEDIEETKFFEAANFVAAAPLFLRVRRVNNKPVYDTYDNVRYCFAVSLKNGVRWKSVNGLVEIKDNVKYVKLLEKGWDTLIAYIELPIPVEERINDVDTVDIISKTIPIHITELNNDCDFSPPPPPNFTVELFATPESAGTVAGAEEVNYLFGDKITISAEANNPSDYAFFHWRDKQGVPISTEAEFELTVVSDTVLYAVFHQIGYFVVISVHPSYMGTTEGTGTGLRPYNYDSSVTAIPSADIYKFVYWSSSEFSDTLTKEPTLNFVIKSDTSFVAHFEFDTTSISEIIKIETVNIIPNPTKDNFEISFDVIKSGNIAISLLDLSGGKVFEIFNDFTVEGTFSKTVKTNNLARGVYSLKIEIDENHFKIERIIFE